MQSLRVIDDGAIQIGTDSLLNVSDIRNDGGDVIGFQPLIRSPAHASGENHLAISYRGDHLGMTALGFSPVTVRGLSPIRSFLTKLFMSYLVQFLAPHYSVVLQG